MQLPAVSRPLDQLPSPSALPKLQPHGGDITGGALPAMPKQPERLGAAGSDPFQPMGKLQPLAPTAPPQDMLYADSAGGADLLKPKQPSGAHVPAKLSPRPTSDGGTQSSGRSTTTADDDDSDEDDTGSIDAPQPPDDDLDDGEDEAERELQRRAGDPAAMAM